jgi:hypothetical protein
MLPATSHLNTVEPFTDTVPVDEVIVAVIGQPAVQKSGITLLSTSSELLYLSWMDSTDIRWEIFEKQTNVKENFCLSFISVNKIQANKLNNSMKMVKLTIQEY